MAQPLLDRPLTVRPLKPWLDIPEQIDLLTKRGMRIPDRARAEHALATYGYYRLSGYWYPYRRHDPSTKGRRLDQFVPYTSFDEVIALYEFDRALRRLVSDGIERTEVAVRSRISSTLGRIGSSAHTDPANFRSTFDLEKWSATAGTRIGLVRGADATVDHHDSHYGGQLPFWALSEVIHLSDLSRLYSGMLAPLQNDVAEWFRVAPAPDASKSSRAAWAHNPPLANWLEHLTFVRNLCAHHRRLWDQQLVPLRIPRRIWHLPVFGELIPGFEPSLHHLHRIDRVFGTICVISYLLDTAEPGNTWRDQVDELIATSFPAGRKQSLEEMGFPPSTPASRPSTGVQPLPASQPRCSESSARDISAADDSEGRG